MKKITISVFVLFTALLLSSCGKDQEFNLNNDIDAKVDGYVFDSETQEVLAGVKVTISNQSATTNDKGYFIVSGLSTGTYPVKLEKEGYTSVLLIGAVTIDGKDYYGDAIQTCSAFGISPTNNTLELTFRYFNPDLGEIVDAPAGIEVSVEYNSGSILNTFATYTTNSSGKITVNNVAPEDINIFIDDETVGTDVYSTNKQISPAVMDEFDNNIRILINRSDISLPGDTDM